MHVRVCYVNPAVTAFHHNTCHFSDLLLYTFIFQLPFAAFRSQTTMSSYIPLNCIQNVHTQVSKCFTEQKREHQELGQNVHLHCTYQYVYFCIAQQLCEGINSGLHDPRTAGRHTVVGTEVEGKTKRESKKGGNIGNFRQILDYIKLIGFKPGLK